MDIKSAIGDGSVVNDSTRSTGAIALFTGGIASAFALAACCAIPFLFAGVGIGTAWLAPVVSASQPHAGNLTALSIAALVGSVVIVWRGPQHCQPGSFCARPIFRWTVTIAAMVGVILLILSKIYA